MHKGLPTLQDTTDELLTRQFAALGDEVPAVRATAF